MPYLLLSAAILLQFGGCSAKKTEHAVKQSKEDHKMKSSSLDASDALNEARTLAEISANEGLLQVIGRYEEIDVRQRPNAKTPPTGHVAIRLADGALVYLGTPWSKKSIRPADERDEFRGTQVVVTGVAVSQCPPDPSGGATLMGACLISVAGMVSEEFYLLFKAHEASSHPTRPQ